jgi:hypothetical protein
VIDGPTCGKPGEKIQYEITSTDPEDDYIYYWIDWGDGNIDEWIGPYDSGENVIIDHTYEEMGIYSIITQVKDENNRISNWSMPLNVTISYPPTVEKINGGFRVSFDVKNSGIVEAQDISWQIELSGGLILIGKQTSGQISEIGPNETETVYQPFLFGFGHNVEITVNVGDTSKKALASWILGPLVLGVSDIP